MPDKKSFFDHANFDLDLIGKPHLNPEDFEYQYCEQPFQEQPDYKAPIFFEYVPKITVTYKPTGVSKDYIPARQENGHLSDGSLMNFLRDWKNGLFTKD